MYLKLRHFSLIKDLNFEVHHYFLSHAMLFGRIYLNGFQPIASYKNVKGLEFNGKALNIKHIRDIQNTFCRVTLTSLTWYKNHFYANKECKGYGYGLHTSSSYRVHCCCCSNSVTSFHRSLCCS